MTSRDRRRRGRSHRGRSTGLLDRCAGRPETFLTAEVVQESSSIDTAWRRRPCRLHVRKFDIPEGRSLGMTGTKSGVSVAAPRGTSTTASSATSAPTCVRMRPSARARRRRRKAKARPDSRRRKRSAKGRGLEYSASRYAVRRTGCGSCADCVPVENKALEMRPLDAELHSTKTGRLRRRSPH